MDREKLNEGIYFGLSIIDKDGNIIETNKLKAIFKLNLMEEMEKLHKIDTNDMLDIMAEAVSMEMKYSITSGVVKHLLCKALGETYIDPQHTNTIKID